MQFRTSSYNVTQADIAYIESGYHVELIINKKFDITPDTTLSNYAL